MNAATTIARSDLAGRELEQARAMYEDDYCGVGFRAERSDRDFAFRYTVVGSSNMTLRSSMFLGSISGSIRPENEYVVSWIHDGCGTMDVGVDETPLVPGRPAMFPTGRPFAFRFCDYRQSLIHFDARFLEQVAAEHEGSAPGPILFHHAAAPRPRTLARWKVAVDDTAALVLHGAPTPLQLAELERCTAIALLDTFDHDVTELPAALRLPHNSRLRRAVDYLHAHAHLSVTLTEVAGEVGLSPRGLQQAFRRHFGSTPTEYLRDIRLDRVHAELLALAPGDRTVGSVAAHWGFGHLGRFAGAYAARFGEHPSETLRL